MALIACPECAKDVSDKAATCIHCGNPLHAVSPIVDPGAVVTTQATGKPWKAISLAGAGIMVFGVVACSASGNPFSGIVFMGIGFAVVLVGRIGAWWHHG